MADAKTIGADSFVHQRSKLVSPHGIGWHFTIVSLYTVLSIGLAWPMPRYFGTRLIQDYPSDPRHCIWILWHVKEWLAGRDSLFYTHMLSYPHGISLHLEAVGPLSGFLALPFWHWGPVGAYNGTLLLGCVLSAYCMYLAARGVGLPKLPSLFAGLLLLVWPMHIAAIGIHLEKTFLGLLPLTLMAAARSLDTKGNRLWILATGALMLANLLYTATYFAFCGIGIGLIFLLSFLRKQNVFSFSESCAVSSNANSSSSTNEKSNETRPPGAIGSVRYAMTFRMALVILCTAILAGPVLYRMFQYEHNPAYFGDVEGFSSYFSPDAAQLIIPTTFSAVGHYVADRQAKTGFLKRDEKQYGTGVETAVNIYITALALMVVGFIWGNPATKYWLLLGGFFVLVSLGPQLKILGWMVLSETGLGRLLPYALLNGLPGFKMMRVPGRFALIAGVALSIAAAGGFMALAARYPKWRLALFAIATALLMFEAWPVRWKVQDTLPVPALYQRLAEDDGKYGVLDLPVHWLGGAEPSAYMYYQVFHHKPIAWAYLSRGYISPPGATFQSLLHGTLPADQLKDLLRQMGYKYVVWHKRSADLFPDNSAPPVPDELFLEKAFSGNNPIADDEYIRAWSTEPN